MILQTAVDTGTLPVQINPEDKTTVLGSCFADEIGRHLVSGGFDVMVNPFGTLYNPASIVSSIERLDSARPFTAEDCVQMGAGAGLVCSFSHHSSFARGDEEEFLREANASLEKASIHWKESSKVIITLGTAFVWRHLASGQIVSNCLKRPGYEFSREMLPGNDCARIIESIIAGHPEKEFIFTVSPIRHLSSGAHANSLSKATLLLSLETALRDRPNACYFPAYEIVLDELRDYRFYAEDMVHPSSTAVDIIWEKFLSAAIPARYHETVRLNEKAFRRTLHRPLR